MRTAHQAATTLRLGSRKTVVLRNADDTFTCPLCSRSYRRPRQLQLHHQKCARPTGGLAVVAAVPPPLNGPAVAAVVEQQDDMLLRLNLRIYRPTGVLVCCECRCGIRPSALKNHRAGRHSEHQHERSVWAIREIRALEQRIRQDAYRDVLRPECDLLRDYAPRSPTTLVLRRPVVGVPIEPGLRCLLCPSNFCARHVRTMQQHFREVHTGTARTDARVTVQVVFAGDRTMCRAVLVDEAGATAMAVAPPAITANAIQEIREYAAGVLIEAQCTTGR